MSGTDHAAPPSATAEWICTSCGSTNRKLVPLAVTKTTDDCVTCHTPHHISADARPVRWRAQPA